MQHQLGFAGHIRGQKERSNSWITPKYILEALGEFDLDPCACEPQPWPTAKRMLTRTDNGLTAPWEGRIWLNPPYGTQIRDWMLRMAQHNNGIALVPPRTETKWFFESVWGGKAAAILFIQGRVNFHYPDGNIAKGNAGGGSVLIAYGIKNAEIIKTCAIDGAYLTESGRDR